MRPPPFIWIKWKNLFVRGWVLCGLIILFSRYQSLKGQIPAFYQQDTAWAVRLLKKMTLEEKIGQLFMISAYSDPAKEKWAPNVEEMIKKYKVGGLIFMQGTPTKQAQLCNKYQMLSEVPLLIGMDAEWGVAMRLDSAITLPRNLTLGAIQNDSLLLKYGRELGRQCKTLGVHINFAPVADINNNPHNPVIGDRSFGESKEAVRRRCLMIMQGMHLQGVIATAKHFPGHGNTDVDSHDELPVIPISRRQIDTLELYPFMRLIQQGLQAMMTAHIAVPALDPTPKLPATLSPLIIKKLLIDSLGFSGLVITDALNMGAITKYFKPGEIELKAFLAGNDILLFSGNIPQAIEHIKKAIKDGLISENELNRRVKKILLAKQWVGLHRKKLVDIAQVKAMFKQEALFQLKQQLYESAITLIKNKDRLLPLNPDFNERIGFLQIGLEDNPCIAFQQARKLLPLDFFSIKPEISPASNIVLDKLTLYQTVVVALLHLSRHPPKYGLSDQTIQLIHQIRQSGKKVVLLIFGNPYTLQFFGHEEAIVLGYDRSEEAQMAAGLLISGSIKPQGVLPISAPKRYEKPIFVVRNDKLMLSNPVRGSADSKILGEIDSIANHYIQRGAMPGCAILAVKGNQIIYEKNFGYIDYDKREPVVASSTLYDLASVTKVASTTLCAMRLYEQGKLHLSAPIETYLPEIQGKVGKITVSQLLEHRSGLPAWLPFWTGIFRKGQHDTTLVSSVCNDSFCIPLSDKYFLHKRYAKEVWNKIITYEPNERYPVVYSDLNMIIMGKIIEQITGQPLENYVTEQFYRPLGMRNTIYNPRRKKVQLTIAPTEEDKRFRFTRIQGYVHDENAAILGGATGHAGLFSTIYDMAILMTMLKNGGEYNGKQYFKPETIQYFTGYRNRDSRRGLGWDKPDSRPGFTSPTSKRASLKTFGHTGFTGTCVWADPVHDLVFIFLSNRTFPDPENNLLIRENVRVKMMDSLYRAIEKPPKNYP